MAFQDAPTGSGGGGLSLASVGFAGAGVGVKGPASAGGGYKELLVMALPKDDGLDAAKVIGSGLPDVGEAVRELYCMGFQTGGLQTKDGKDMVLLGDLAFSNRLVLYDLENQVIGWTDYNCSSSIKIKDDKTGSIYTVDAHDISSGWRFQWHKSLFVLLVTALCSYTMF